nr:hypothetical protein [Bacillus cereus]
MIGYSRFVFNHFFTLE